MDPVERLHRRLLATLLRDPTSPHPPKVTVGDVYQRLVPYRAVRAELGIFELAVYEHTLLRLLAGEHGLVEVADEAARLEFQRELAGTSPILGIYRDYSEVPVRVLPAAMPRDAMVSERKADSRYLEMDAARVSPAGSASERSSVPAGEPSPAPARERSPGSTREPSPVPAREPSPMPVREQSPARTQAPGAAAGSCVACSRPVPELQGLRFCPFCGVAQRAEQCGRCGDRVEAGWSFCARCGAARARTP